MLKSGYQYLLMYASTDVSYNNSISAILERDVGDQNLNVLKVAPYSTEQLYWNEYSTTKNGTNGQVAHPAVAKCFGQTKLALT